ncbi:MAG: hypothetical protein F2901_04105 [Actinobacteria bacterium]|nr:hypothetical protein [Actinomycetota bacterium]MTH92634.1 hypothetical protein [Actinomycetota bacterium]
MGFFSNIKQRRAEKEALEQAAAEQAQHGTWQSQSEQLDVMINAVERCGNNDIEGLFDPYETGFILKKDEYAIGLIANCALLETRRSASTYQGGYGGVSFPLFGKVRLNTGRSKGKLVPGEESITSISDGEVLITNKRAMFRGDTNNKEWPYSKLMACEHHPEGYTTFAVSAQTKTTGFAYGADVANEVQFRLELGIAISNETTDQLLAQLRVERQQLDAKKPLPPPVVGLSNGENPR